MDPGEKLSREAPEQAAEPEVQRYLRTILERRWVVVATIVVGGLVFLRWASKQPRIYQATATIVVDATPPQIMGGEVRDVVQVGPGQYWQMQDYIQTQRRVLTSDTLARQVVERLQLAGDEKFWMGPPPGSLEDAAHAFIDSVQADAIPDTQLISVSFLHRDQDQAKRAVDGLVDVYIDSNGARRDSSNANASTWLASEADAMRKRLSDSEKALYDFKEKNDLLSLSLDERVSSAGAQIIKLTDALTEVRLTRARRATEAEQLAKTELLEADELSPVAAALSLETLRGQLHDEQRKLSELKARYEDPHPLVRQQVAKVHAAEAAVHAEVTRLVHAAQARVDEAGAQEKRIAAQLEAAKQDGLRVSRLELDYNKLRRETDALSKQYLQVANRNKETELASKIKANNLHVLDYARRPTMSVSPHLTRSGIAALLISLLVGIVLALLLDALDRSVKTQDDVETKLKLPFLGLMPKVQGGNRPELFVADNPSSPAAECCRVVRTNLLFAGLKRPLRKILVTSSLAREGKTLTTVSLGTVMAHAGNKVLLIDADLRSPRLRSALQIERDVGLTDVLLGNMSLEEAIQPTGIPNLFVLLSGGVPPNPAEVIEGQRFRELLDTCADKYERVMIDSPPVLPVTDPAILATYCDGVVLVLRAGKTSQTQARRIRQTLLDLGARILGAVLNDADVTGRSYGYGYGYGKQTKAARAAVTPKKRSLG